MIDLRQSMEMKIALVPFLLGVGPGEKPILINGEYAGRLSR
jgi:hypothetical protein